MSDAPSGWRIETALSAWMSARARLLAEDPELDGDEAALSAMLGDEAGDVEDVLARLLRAAVHAGDMADAAKDRAKAINERGARYERREESMRGAAFAIMEAMGIKKHEMPDMSATIGKPRIGVAISDEAAIPDEYWRVTRAVDKAKIRADLTVGVVIDGATLETGLPSFTIRTK